MNKKCFLGIVFIILCLFSTVTLASSERLQSALDNAVLGQEVPGIQATVIFPSGEVWNGASGFVDRRGETPIDSSHILLMGSITKTYTAAIIMSLVEEGILTLHDPLSNWFPDFPRAQEVQVYMLLNHTSGIFNYTEDIRYILKSIIPSRTNTPQEMLDIARKKKYYHEPGTAFHYSNTNYVFLGLIASQVTGIPMDQLIAQVITAPLGLENTYLLPCEPFPEKLIHGFDRDLIPIGIQRIPSENRAITSGAFTAGGMASTTFDIACFLHSLFSGRIVQEETLEEMMFFDNSMDSNYGLGLFKIQVKGIEFWGHNGAIPGFKSFAFHSPEEGFTIAIMGNLFIFDAQKVFEDLLGAIIDG